MGDGAAHSGFVMEMSAWDPEGLPYWPTADLPQPTILWVRDYRSDQLFLCARFSDVLRAIDPGYPHRLPGSTRSAAEQLECRRRIAERVGEELVLSPFPWADGSDLDPTSDGSLLRGLAARRQISFGRL